MPPRSLLALAIGAAALAVGLAWHFAPRPITAGSASEAADSAPLPVKSVLRVRPSTGSSPAPASRLAARSQRAVSPELALFRARHDYAGLYRTLKSNPPTAESLYLVAEIYAACARSEGESVAVLARERSAKRERLIAGLTQGIAAAAQRIDAYDRLNADPCQDLDLGAFGQALEGMLAAAVDAGDPRARAWQLAERIERAYYERQSTDRENKRYDLSEADFDQARALLATNDPEVIQDLQGVLSSSLAHGSIRFGGEAVDQQALHAALSLSARSPASA